MARGKKKETALTPEEKLQEALVPENEWPYKVPENWKWIRFEALKAEPDGFFDGNWILSENMDSEGIVRLLQLSDIGIGEFLNKSDKHISENTFLQLGCTPLHEGDVMISRMAEPIARSCIVPSFPYTVITAVDVAVLRCNPSIVFNCYVNYLCNAKWFTDLAFSMARGTTRVRITRKNLGQMPFPLPPLPEQHRIVDRIESLFAKLDEAKEKAQLVVDGFEDRKAAILHKAFTGELTEEWRARRRIERSSWVSTTSTNLFEYVTSGSRGWAQYYADDGAVFIRMGNLDHGTIELDLSEIQYVKLPSKAEGQRSLVQKGDILISITADVGMIGLVRDIDFEGYINQHVALARPVNKENAEFIAWYLVSDVGFTQFRYKQRGATKVGLGLNDIRTLSLDMPCKEEQDEILRILDSLLIKEQQAKDAAEQVIAQIDTMKKSILARAFRGELGTNNPSDESAEELLKRIL